MLKFFSWWTMVNANVTQETWRKHVKVNIAVINWNGKLWQKSKKRKTKFWLQCIVSRIMIWSIGFWMHVNVEYQFESSWILQRARKTRIALISRHWLMKVRNHLYFIYLFFQIFVCNVTGVEVRKSGDDIVKMHNKFCLIDPKTSTGVAISGSLNWSYAVRIYFE